jgi:predicted Fe-Mo cluster-binding NifX family protein
MEVGVNRYLSERDDLYSPDIPNEISATNTVDRLKRLIRVLPTQTKRTAETDEFQQFSTPPPLAYVVNWVANINKDDVVLEPSAGTGNLAVFAKNAGANEVIVNELSPRRANLLKLLGFDKVFTEKGEQINNLLPKNVKPTVVVMNPPFSATAGRITGRRATKEGARHIEQALARLEPNGRLVAIVGKGMADNAPAFRNWWKKIKEKYNVRANIGISGKGYKKYGTTFDNQLIIIDKTGKTEYNIVKGKVENVEDLLPLLKEIRDARIHPGEQREAKPGVEKGPEERGGKGRPEHVVLPTTGEVGPGEREAEGTERPTGREPKRPTVRMEPEGGLWNCCWGNTTY